MGTKQTVKALLDPLPDDCSIDDVLYRLYIIQAVIRGQEDVAASRTIPHEQVVEWVPRNVCHTSLTYVRAEKANRSG